LVDALFAAQLPRTPSVPLRTISAATVVLLVWRGDSPRSGGRHCMGGYRPLPLSLQLSLNDLTYSVTVPDSDLRVNGYFANVGGLLKKLAMPWSRGATHQVKVLDGLQGVIPAGRSTLILGAPGSGKSVLLRLLAARLKPDTPQGLTFNGLTATAARAADVDLKRVVAYAPQEDVHEALLTVRLRKRQCQGGLLLLSPPFCRIRVRKSD
jgi:hypothetical protein